MAQLLDQADRLQLAQRLPDRRAADAEARRQVLLAQAGAERDAPGEDLDLQLVREVVRARLGCSWGRAMAPILSTGVAVWNVPVMYPKI